jgi:hypothetical protein
MSWAFLKVRRFQKFGSLKVIDYYDRPRWVLCLCRYGSYRDVKERGLLGGGDHGLHKLHGRDEIREADESGMSPQV